MSVPPEYADHEFLPGDMVVMRGICGFWPDIEMADDGVHCNGMRGASIGRRCHQATVLVLSKVDNVRGGQALLVLTAGAGVCWTWAHGLLDTFLGDGEIYAPRPAR